MRAAEWKPEKVERFESFMLSSCLCTVDQPVNILNDEISVARSTRYSEVFTLRLIPVTSAILALSACSAASSGDGTPEAAVTGAGPASNNRAGGKDEAVTTPPVGEAPRPARPATIRPGDLTPSPIQPPAEVDPPHRSPGDRVDPAPPKTGTAVPTS